MRQTQKEFIQPHFSKSGNAFSETLGITKSANLISGSRKSGAGFTLIELLVVIAIIGILASVVLLSLNSARQKSRDARRVADVRQIASALELYFNDNHGYPNVLDDLTTPTAYVGIVPVFPTPADGCNTTSYTYATNADASTYTLRFCISQVTGGLSPAGTHTLSQAGIE